MKRGYWIAKMVVFGIVGMSLFVYIAMMLWNWLVPVLFGGPVITFWQTLGLLVLSKIFLWTFGKKGNSHGGWRPYWKEKWQAMTPEEKEKFKQKMKGKWCYQPREDKDGISNG